MSLIRHDSIPAEELAKAWHWFGAFVSAISVILGAGGLVWHIYATRQHDEAIREMRKWLT